MDVMTAAWSAASLLPPVSTGTGAAYQTLFLALRRVILDRTLTMTAAGDEVQMTVTEVVSLLDPYHVLVGRLDIRLRVSDIRWGEDDFGEANVVLRNVQLRPGAPPVVFAAPVEVTLDVPGATVDALLRRARPELSGVIDDDGVARLHWARHPGWGNVEVDVDLDDSRSVAVLRVAARALTLAGRRLRVPAGRQPYHFELHRLPAEVQLTGVETAPGVLRLHALIAEWQHPG